MKSPKSSICLLFVFSCIAFSGAFAQCWTAPEFYPAQGGTYSLAKGDVNGDLILDIVTVNATGNSISVMPGNATGTFPTVTSYSTGSNASDITMSDLDADGDLDIATSAYAGPVSIHINDGLGVFSPGATYSVPASQGITSGDFDGDLDYDLAVISYSANMVYIFPNNGNATFAAATTFSSGGANPGDIVSGQFNSDSNLDLAVVNITSNNLVLFTGNGNGTFTPGTPATTGTYPRQIAVQDINGDNYPDFAVANNYAGAGASVFLNTNGSLSLTATIASPVCTPLSVMFLKLQGDNNWDIAVGNNGAMIQLAKGNANGTFQRMESFQLMLGAFSYPVNYYTQLYRMERMDVNGDGIDDLVGANYQNNGVNVITGNVSGWINAQWHNYYNPANISSWGYILSEDMNNDNEWDLVTIGYDKDSIAFLTGNGDGTFQYDSVLYAGDGPSDMSLADFNGDSFKDIAVLNYLDKTIMLFLNNGTGSFTASSFSINSLYPYRMATADLDNDTDMDFLIVDNSSGVILTYLNNGTSVFSQGITIPNTNGYYYGTDITAGYFNTDSVIDFAVSYSTQQKLSVFLASGILNYPVSYDLGGSSYANRAENADMNNDGETDLLLNYTSGSGGGTYVYLNGGSGNFSYTSTAAAGEYNYCAEVADFNLDGNPDIASTAAFANGPGINNGNGNGTFSAVDFEYTILADPGGAAARDFNGDGSTDLAVTDIGYRTITVLTNAVPVVDLGQDRVVCNGTTLSVGGQGNYVWSTGATTNTINVTTSGTYYVSFTNACITRNDTVVITVDNPAAPVISASGPTTFCTGDSVILTSGSAVSYLWSTSDTGQSITVNTSGTYLVTTTNISGCTASASQAVTVNPLPVVTVSYNPDTLCLNNSSISLTGGLPAGGGYSGPGVSGGMFDPNAAGLGTHFINYLYTDGAGCSGSDSATIFVDACTGIKEEPVFSVTISPNPCTDHFTVTASGNTEHGSLRLFDLVGNEVVMVNTGDTPVKIYTGHMSAGIYFYEFSGGNKVLEKGKLIITR